MQRNQLQQFEQLEERRLMAVMAAAVNGDLTLSGTADAAVEIVATGNTTFDVFEGGELVASLTGIDDDIRINLDQVHDSSGDVEQELSLQLEGANVDRIIARFGDGPNRLVLESGKIRGGLQYFGGAGDDSLEIEEDFVIGRGLLAFLGDGDNSFEMRGSVQRSLTVHAGDGDDLFDFSDSSALGLGVNIRAGDGDNQLALAGGIEGSLSYRGGDGEDLIDLLATSAIARRATFWLGDGDNSLSVEGSVGSQLRVSAGSGDDSVLIGQLANLSQKARMRLGSGDNVVAPVGEESARLPVAASTDVEAEMAVVVELAAQLRQLLRSGFEFHGSANLT